MEKFPPPEKKDDAFFRSAAERGSKGGFMHEARELNRRYPKIFRTFVLTFSLEAIGIGVAAEKRIEGRSAERTRLEELEKRPDRAELFMEKLKKAKELFGEHLFVRGAKQESGLLRDEVALREKLEDPLYFPDVRDLPKPAAKEASTELSIEDIPAMVWDDEKQNFLTKEFPASAVADVVDRTLPKKWGRGEVSAITYVNTDEELPSRYGIAGAKKLADAGKVSGDKGVIRFFAAAKEELPERLIGDTLLHEVAHLNDWVRDGDMSVSERLDILLAVAERLSSPDRYMSSYVEVIKNEDPKRELHEKAKEYWAEVASQYFRDPSKLHIKDVLLVDVRVRKDDPDFHAKKAAELRAEIIEAAIQKAESINP